MPLYQLTEPAEPLVAPAVVAAFDGWIDAAGASTAGAEQIAGDSDPIVTFESDLLYDYRSRRPVLDIVDGTLTELTWPDLTIRPVGRGARDLLVLSGPEPDFRWRELGRDLLEVAVRLGAVEWVNLGAIPAAVPHTRPVPILATASKPGLLHEDEQQGPAGLLRVPSAALSAIEMTVAGSGIPTVGFYAQVPHYVGGPYAAATIALLEHAGRHLGVDLPLGPLPDEAMAQRERLDAAVASDEESRVYLARLESVADNQELPTGDELVGEIERFLQQRGGDGGQGPIGGPGPQPS
ncbi:MAG TPA: PAC2 family protein [Actinomycetota bacterium]